MHKLISIIIITVFTVSIVNSQIIDNPVVNVKSHPTLNIEKISKTESTTVFHMNIKNELAQDGRFCVDNKVFLSIPGKNIKFDMIRSEGIENCPEMHEFTKVGESLSFKLIFPNISDTIIELDLVEDCNEDCFYIRGINLDQIFNKEVHDFDTGVIFYRDNNVEKALSYFKEIVESSKYKKSKHYAYSMYILPVIYQKLGKRSLANKTYQDLVDSDIIDKEYFINKLNEIEGFGD